MKTIETLSLAIGTRQSASISTRLFIKLVDVTPQPVNLSENKNGAHECTPQYCAVQHGTALYWCHYSFSRLGARCPWQHGARSGELELRPLPATCWSQGPCAHEPFESSTSSGRGTAGQGTPRPGALSMSARITIPGGRESPPSRPDSPLLRCPTAPAAPVAVAGG